MRKQRRRSASRCYREADLRLCFRYLDSTIPLLSKLRNFKPLAIFCSCTAWFVSDQVANPEDRFSHNEAHTIAAISVSICAYFCSDLMSDLDAYAIRCPFCSIKAPSASLELSMDNTPISFLSYFSILVPS